MFNCRTYNAPNVRSIDVYWNDGLDSLIVPVELKTGYDSISIILENMEEKSYTFDVRTTDNFGHKSLYLTDFGTSYGEIYQSRLSDRRIKTVSLSDKGGIVTWYFAPSDLVCSEIRYTKNDGSLSVTETSSIKDVTELPDIKPGSTIEYRSLFIPEVEAIDTFATAWKTFPVIPMADRRVWWAQKSSMAKTFGFDRLLSGADSDIAQIHNPIPSLYFFTGIRRYAL